MSFDLQNFSEALGWQLAGACEAKMSPEHKAQFREWIQKYKGPQMNYLERRLEERLDPSRYFPEVQSVLCFGLAYFPGWAEGEVKVSNYSWGEDYHEALKEKLEETASALQEKFPSMLYRSTVDTAPVAEKYWAIRSGIGWQGKNSLILNRRWGSLFFLGEILCNLPIETFNRLPLETDHCGTCQRCIEACPTDALEPYRLDAGRCISYWTLEHKGDFGRETPPFREWVAGCDICQEVCPWNRKLEPQSQLKPELGLQKLKAEEVASPEWPARIEGKAVSYVRPENWKRNLTWVKKSS